MIYKMGCLSLAVLLAGCATTGEQSEHRSRPVTSDYTKSSGGALKPSQQVWQIDHADLSFKLFPKKQAIAGQAVLMLEALGQTQQAVLDLDRVFTIEKITVDGIAIERKDWSNPEGLMTITLPHRLEKGDTVKLEIDYNGVPLVAKKAPWDGGFVWQKTDKGDPWIATAVQFEGCDVFWPCIDNPMREPKSLDIHLSVPAPLVGATNGRLLGVERKDGWNTYHWQTNKSTNTYAVALNVGPYELMEDTYHSRFGNDIDMQYWHLKGHTEGAKKLFSEFPKILDFFESMIGPYPFGDEKMGVVDTPHLGMEHQTINAYGNKYKVDRFGFDWLLHHEFSHEWFGNQLTHNSQDDMWLHEGFGSYMQPLYAQYLYGDMAYFTYLYDMRQKIVNKAPLVAGEPRNEEQVYSKGPAQDIYFKGAMFLHTLRQLIGDQAFFSSVRQLVYGTDTPRPGNFKPRNADTQDFVDIVNKTAGRDLNWLFHVYLYQKALPALVTERKGDRMTLRWKTEDDAPFPMPLEVSVDGRLVKLDMADMSGSLEVSPSAVVIIDPHAKVLRDQPHFDAYRKAQEKQKKAH